MESDVPSCASDQHAISDTAPQHDQAKAYEALASLVDAVYCVDTSGRIIFVNAAFEAISGYTLADLSGIPSTRLYVPEAEALFTERCRQVYSGTPVSPYLETLLLLQDGRRLPVELSVSILRIEGRIVGRIASLRDITERKQTEAALRESEARFQLLANAAPVLIWVNGPNGCEFVNRPYLAFLGLSSETDVRGYNWSPYVHPDDREAYMKDYLAAVEARLPFAARFRFQRADGVYRWFQSVGTPRLLPDGTFLGYVGCSFDITEMCQAEAVLEQRVAERTAALEQALVERQRLEREAQRAEHFVLLGRLAAGVSHELRNPLGAVFLQVDLLAEELAHPSPNSPAALAEALDEIKTELARVDDIVQDYL